MWCVEEPVGAIFDADVAGHPKTVKALPLLGLDVEVQLYSNFLVVKLQSFHSGYLAALFQERLLMMQLLERESWALHTWWSSELERS